MPSDVRMLLGSQNLSENVDDLIWSQGFVVFVASDIAISQANSGEQLFTRDYCRGLCFLVTSYNPPAINDLKSFKRALSIGHGDSDSDGIHMILIEKEFSSKNLLDLLKV
jgi:hypothetical protein